MQRRTFFTSALAAAATSLSVPAATPNVSVQSPSTLLPLIDTNVSLGHWPIRRSWAETPSMLVAKLQQHGVTSAWTANFDGALHSDLASSNARLADACTREGAGVLVPFGTVNPTLPAWQEDVTRCVEQHRMPGIRLFPNYHGYALDDPRFAELLELATVRGLLVQIALSMEDDRSQNPVFAVPPVQTAPLLDVLKRIPSARVMLLNSSSRVLAGNNPLLQRLSAAGVYFEIATLEGVAGIETLLRTTTNLRLTFGSHTPYFYFEAALLKLQESALTPAQLAAISYETASAALSH